MSLSVIYKYPFKIQQEFDLLLPAPGTIVKVEMQGKTPCMWVLHAPDAEKQLISFRLVGTGEEFVYDAREYSPIFTFQNFPFVWHLFVIGPKEETTKAGEV